ncbi:MAG: ribosome silencing factor [Bacteroidota bacterium]
MTEATSAYALTNIAIEGLAEKKGIDILRMDLTQVDSSVTDYFIICTGSSNRHVQSLAESALEFVKKQTGEMPIAKEGLEACEWVLLDFVNVVVHIFQQKTRDFYKLEDLWGDAELESIEVTPANSRKSA